MMRGNIIFFGHRPYGIFVIKYLLEKGYKIPCVFVPGAATPETIAELKKTLPGSDIYEGGKLTAKEMLDNVKKYQYRAMLATFYQGLIPEDVIKLGVVNIHGAPLPEWRGAGTLNWAIVKGATKTGVTIHIMDENLDSGDIIDMIEYPINYEDNVSDVQKRMFQKTVELLDRCWEPYLNSKIKLKPQDHNKAHYYRAWRPDDFRIDWNENASDVRNLVRGVAAPFAGAFCLVKGQKVILEKAEVEIDNKVHFKAGKVLSAGGGALCRVTAGFNLLSIEKVRDGEAFKKLDLKAGDFLE
jgi:methionyl-tRNA formyltransferase